MSHPTEKFQVMQNAELRKILKEQSSALTQMKRELEIEAALERIRSRAMAMQKSSDLLEVIKTVTDQIKYLRVEFEGSNFVIENPDKSWLMWLCTREENFPFQMYIPYFNHRGFIAYNKAKENNLNFYTYVYTAEENISWMQHFFTNATPMSVIPDLIKTRSEQLMKSSNHAASVFLYDRIVFSVFRLTDQPFTEIENTIFKRIGNVFEQAYIRFLDLQKAEAQTREAEIELALERVRSKTISMKKSDDLLETSLLLFQQLRSLGNTAEQVAIGIVNEEEGVFELSATVYGNQMMKMYKPPLNDTFIMGKVYQAWKAKQKTFEITLSGEELRKYNISRNSIMRNKLGSKNLYNENIGSEDRWTASVACFSKGVLSYSSSKDTPEDSLKVLERFSDVFEQTYTRFLDLKKAEAQAREAEIETALEKVRSQSMSMHKSTELLDVISVLSNQLLQLGFKIESANFNTTYREKDWNLWLCNPGRPMYPDKIHIPYLDHPYFNRTLDSLSKGSDFNSFVFTKKEKDSFLDHLFTHTIAKDTEEEIKKMLYSKPGFAWSVVYLKNTCVTIANYDAEPYTEEQNAILRRFGNAFEQSYTRFLDLQKAEAQAREAQIELGLERVRAKAMAMQNSEELNELIGTVFNELTKLDFSLTRCVIMIYDPASYDVRWWMANSEAPSKPMNYLVKHHNMVMPEKFVQAWQARELKWQFHLEGKTKKEWDNFIFSNTELSLLPDFVIAGMKAPDSVWLSASFNNFGSLTLASLEPLSDEHFDIMLRFAKVFDLTYTRFNDLQKAEEQAKEAQIETGLERVRYSAMAMQSSEDVGAATAVVFNEISILGIEAMRCGIAIMHLDKTADVWAATATSEGKEMKGVGSINFNDHPLWIGLFDAWKNKAESYTYALKDDDLKSYYKILASSPNYNSSYIQNRDFPDHFFYAGFFEQGALFTFSLQPHDDEKRKILKKFTAVFSLTFRRYLDLKQAEAQTREAQIEAALERVRSRTLAMQKSDELAETAAEVFRQLITLGIEPNRLYIGIIKSDEGEMEMWATDEDGTHVGKKFMFHKKENVSVKKLFDGWATKQKSVIVNMEGKELDDYFHYLNHVLHIPFKEGLSQKRRVQSVAYFSQGFIGMASPDGQGDETIHLLERFAAVFNLTFTRFNDLKIAEAHAEQAEMDLIQLKEEKKRTEDALNELQITQKQLIQAEKMASLGELTAGIAHEIQNPLNFVNNFSEVSTELVDEMNEEIQKGNIVDAQQIATDLKDNLIKINHHGKRAGEIVRSMLQHSRSSSGKQEPTDINVLCDEYLRLSYHGLRAKDKSFNASFETVFDDTIGKILIQPQEIGRVVLNLINNAFYAVAERKKNSTNTYDPKVIVTTENKNDTILIIVKDNGTGISQKIVEKIFQPFFTTKPTGQGTGLGLSLSYDIIKAHGGELKVETKDGEGTVFIIKLPIS